MSSASTITMKSPLSDGSASKKAPSCPRFLSICDDGTPTVAGDVRGNYLSAEIGRAVVDDNDLELRIVLRFQGLDRVADVLGVVPVDDDQRDQRQLRHPAGQRAQRSVDRFPFLPSFSTDHRQSKCPHITDTRATAGSSRSLSRRCEPSGLDAPGTRALIAGGERGSGFVETSGPPGCARGGGSGHRGQRRHDRRRFCQHGRGCRTLLAPAASLPVAPSRIPARTRACPKAPTRSPRSTTSWS